ncbi:hypothetical protein [Mycetocola sp. JXN-3]|uniref:hypothetical protein n=1 Tax=Mycetocola sp. JXN-3 TaxID=2116510 RepID=UPI00165CFF13|nr:hypothetical protein [Mycetocola sp. JXN-3]
MLKETSLRVVANGLSAARFDTYLAAADGSMGRALRLYRWNASLSAAWAETLAHTEIFLRNRIDVCLREWNAANGGRGDGVPYSPEWTFRAARPLHSLLARPLDSARRQAAHAQQIRAAEHPRVRAQLVHDDLIAHLSFGVFVNLLPTPHSSATHLTQRRILWDEALAPGFPHLAPAARDGFQTGTQATRLHALRNRVAHAEPLLDVRSDRRLRDVGRLLASMDPRFAGWVTGGSRVQDVLKQRPG